MMTDYNRVGYVAAQDERMLANWPSVCLWGNSQTEQSPAASGLRRQTRHGLCHSWMTMKN
jgi:hypothetical protein